MTQPDIRRVNYCAWRRDYCAALFNAFASLDFFLAAVFLWISFFAAALSIALTVLLKTAFVSMPDAIADLHFLTDVLSADLRTTFLAVLFLVTFTRLIADLILGNITHLLCAVLAFVYKANSWMNNDVILTQPPPAAQAFCGMYCVF
jgi:hypothetical protein